ncbi:MAG: DUF6600 domain-containing protein, partial [Ignavibacterium sp.]
MKKLVAIIVFLFIGLTASAETSTHLYNRMGGYFYTNLSPYGTWIEIDYGVVAWRPTIIKRNWAPYKIGRWVWTDYGWYWDSYEPFGHIVFHYGRWYYDDYYGWIWIPDDEWAPAWVEWRYDDDYIGWAPLHPYAVFSVNFGIRITYNYNVPYAYWHFVTYRYLPFTMKKHVFIFFWSVLACLAVSQNKTQKVAVFKNGWGFFINQTEVKTQNKVYDITEIPKAAMGTLWYVSPELNQISKA